MYIEILASGTFVQNGVTQAAQAASYVSHPATGEVMDATTLGVANLTGNAGDDSLTGDVNANWLAGNQGSETFNAGVGDMKRKKQRAANDEMWKMAA